MPLNVRNVINILHGVLAAIVILMIATFRMERVCVLNFKCIQIYET